MTKDNVHCYVGNNERLTGFTLDEFERMSSKREIVKGYCIAEGKVEVWDYGHYWKVCPDCGPAVVCGNNACNAGHGTLEDGSKCTACNAAYDIQATQYPGTLVWEDRWWNLKAYTWRYIGWYFWKAWDNICWHLWQKQKWEKHDK